MLVSVHIPKTGGTSFQEFLKLHFKEGLFLDYVDKPMSKDSDTRNREAMENQANSKNCTYDCVHGHFLPVKYDVAEKNNVFAVWFRDPVERVISRFYHGKRNVNGHLVTESMSLEEFCEIERLNNLYEKYLWNFSINKFDFIGITEDYDNSLQLFRKQLGINALGRFHANANPNKMKNTYEITTDLRKTIFNANRQDYEIYREALDINNKLKKKFLV
ncbi:MAG: sulfotransferase family 2 domain-containing protein [Methylovulum miyakonense]|uniref:sulfotransferase family 2 domain-containing protein n=1 Tax=Methylovulum miyakonense TaxID=645578 RepID=UPI003BB628E9